MSVSYASILAHSYAAAVTAGTAKLTLAKQG
jgi:hypothetical protein